MDFCCLTLPTPKSSEWGSDGFYAGLTPSQTSRKPQHTSIPRVQGGCRPAAPSHWPSHQRRRPSPHLWGNKRTKEPKYAFHTGLRLLRHEGWARGPLLALPMVMADHERLRGSSRVDGRAPMSRLLSFEPSMKRETAEQDSSPPPTPTHLEPQLEAPGIDLRERIVGVR